MTEYNFDTYLDRTDTNSLKHDSYKEHGFTKDHIPLWVADMDFPILEEIKQSVIDIATKGAFGYSGIPQSYYDAVSAWMHTRHAFTVKEEHFVLVPGVAYSLSAAVCAYTQQMDSVLIQTPVYSPFYKVIETNNRVIVKNPLVYQDGKYVIDFDDFEKKIIENSVKLFLMSNPHNPVGKVFTKTELESIASICERHNVIVVSDEVHHDYIYEGHEHIVFSNINSWAEQNCIICTSASKTFNVAGLKASNIFIFNKRLRDIYKKELYSRGPSPVNALGIAANEAAYKYGAHWVDKVLEYLSGNLKYIEEYMESNFTDIKLVRPEGSYLAWIDCTQMPLNWQQINDFFKNDAKLWLNNGDFFGEDGKKFQRMNIASTRSVLQETMARMSKARSFLDNNM